MNNKLKIIACVVGFVVAVTAVFSYNNLFGAPAEKAEIERFVVKKDTGKEVIVEALRTQGFVKNIVGFRLALSFKKINDIPFGAYKISKAMNAWEITKILGGEPYMKWVTIPEGLRKEEIAELLQKELGWTNEETQTWIIKDTAEDADYTEGVYFPDTYLIPVDEPTQEVAKRLRAKFEEKFAPYAKEALEENIRWPTLLKIASIVQREAAGKSDMPLIAGVIWNRLLNDTRLEVDATLQYARGKTNKGWWTPISSEDKKLESPYNTYKEKGLPPTPISNPGVTALNAVLHPEKTKCFFYIHDNSKQIHCAETFEEHKANIEKYLR